MEQQTAREFLEPTVEPTLGGGLIGALTAWMSNGSNDSSVVATGFFVGAMLGFTQAAIRSILTDKTAKEG